MHSLFIKACLKITLYEDLVPILVGAVLKTGFLFMYRKGSICRVLAITCIIPVYCTCCYNAYNETRHDFDNREMYYPRTMLIDNVCKSMFDNCSACCINRNVLIFRQLCCKSKPYTLDD